MCGDPASVPRLAFALMEPLVVNAVFGGAGGTGPPSRRIGLRDFAPHAMSEQPAARRPCAYHLRRGGKCVQVLVSDGSVHPIKATIDPTVFRTVATHDGRRIFEQGAYRSGQDQVLSTVEVAAGTQGDWGEGGT